MKTKTKLNLVREAVKLTALVAGKRSTLPTTNHVLIKADGSTMKIIGSDMQSFIESTCACETEQPGSACIPAEKLLAFLQNSTAEDVSFEIDGSKVHAVSGRSEVRFAFITEREFPEWPSHKSEWAVSLPEKELVRGVDTAKNAMDDNLGRAALSGLLMELKENRFHFTASVGSFLLHVSTEHIGDGRKAILSHDVVEFISRACHIDGESMVEIGFSENGALVKGDGFRILGPIINSEYPNWRSFLPKDLDKTYVFPRKQTLDRVKAVKHFTDERFNPIRLHFKDSLLTLSNTGGEHDSKETVELDCLAPEFKVNVVPSYFVEILSAMKGEKVEMQVKDDLAPMIFNEQDFIGVLMPCRL